MTTATSSSRVRHDSDATFREWGLEFKTKLLAVGLVQTADTGQIDWTTVTRPATNTEGGFETYRFADASQSGAPIFIRFGYGTGSGTTTPRIQWTVGTGTNGSGTITGTAPFTVGSLFSGGAETTDTLRNSYFCHADSALTIVWKVGANVQFVAVIQRTVDSSGAGDTVGAMVLNLANSFLTTACMKFSGTQVITAKKNAVVDCQICHWPQSPTASLTGSDQQAATSFGIYPRVQPHIGCVGVINSEFVGGTTFSDTPVGTTPHTYVVGPALLFMDAASLLKPAVLFE